MASSLGFGNENKFRGGASPQHFVPFYHSDHQDVSSKRPNLQKNLQQSAPDAFPGYQRPSPDVHSLHIPGIASQWNGGGTSTGIFPDMSASQTARPGYFPATGLPHFGNALSSQGDTRTQLFVGNLPFRVRWQDLKDLMRKCGTVLRADVALTPTDGRSRGFGVVLFAHRDDALKAIEVYNGFNWQTRVLDVRLDSQDPTGTLAVAEANRQIAVLQFQQYQQLTAAQHSAAWPSPLSMTIPTASRPSPPHIQSSSSFSTLRTADTSTSSGLSSPRIASQEREYDIAAISRLQSSQISEGLKGHNNSSTRMTSSHTPHLNAINTELITVTTDNTPLLTDVEKNSTELQQCTTASADAMSGKANLSSSNIGSEEAEHQELLVLNQPPIPQNFATGTPATLQPPPHLLPPSPIPPPHPPTPRVLIGSTSQYSQVKRPQPNPAPSGAPNRYLFVGNLPFNCQWQELKDLMRQAGPVLRADISQGSDGRSRGFGSVLFSSTRDAEKAAQMFNGSDYNGRALKVHFDKFSHSPSLQHAYPVPHPSLSPFPPPYPIMHHPMDRFVPYHDHQDFQGAYMPEKHRQTDQPVQSEHPNEDKTLVQNNNETQNLDLESKAPIPVSAVGTYKTTNATVPTRIAMPPPYPFSGPMSPLHARLPAMTPSMPAFTFTLGAYPQTPPVYPHFFSPGLGPFSPIAGSPYFGPGQSRYINAAPGAPVHYALSRDQQGSENAQDVTLPLSSKAQAGADQSYFALAPIPSMPDSDPLKNPLATTVAASSDKGSGDLRFNSPLDEADLLSTAMAKVDVAVKDDSTETVDSSTHDGASMGSAVSAGWAPSLSTRVGDAGGPRRRSFVTGTAAMEERATAFDIRRRFEGEGQGRRASFEDSSKSRPAFGSSIWAE